MKLVTSQAYCQVNSISPLCPLFKILNISYLFYCRKTMNRCLLMLLKVSKSNKSNKYIVSVQSKVRFSLHTSQGARQAGAFPGFCNMNGQGVLLLPPPLG